MNEELAKQWFCSIKGAEIGPISARQLSQLASTGKLESSDLVRRGDLEKWYPAVKVKGLSFLSTTDGPTAHVEEQNISTNQVVGAASCLQ